MFTQTRALVLLVVVSGCTGPLAVEQPVWRDVSGQAFGTTWRVKWSDGPGEGDATVRIDAVLAEIDAAMSSWRQDSELSRARRSSVPLVVSEDTAAVVHAALALAAASGGAFDPTVQPLMEVWGFHKRDAAFVQPSDAALAEARAAVGWQRVVLGRDEQARPTLDVGGAALDLSAIAKGHAVDRVSHALSALGAADHLVEIGGEVRGHGRGPSGPWRLAIDAPVAGAQPGEQVAGIASLVNRSLASSGNYRNVVVVDGQRMGHTMDPRLGAPVQTSIAATTAIAPDCRTADGVATALMVLDLDAGQRLVEAMPDVEALWLVHESGAWQHHLSSGAGDWITLRPAGAAASR